MESYHTFKRRLAAITLVAVGTFALGAGLYGANEKDKAYARFDQALAGAPQARIVMPASDVATLPVAALDEVVGRTYGLTRQEAAERFMAHVKVAPLSPGEVPAAAFGMAPSEPFVRVNYRNLDGQRGLGGRTTENSLSTDYR